MVDLNQRHTHPRDKDVSFDEKTHTYTINGSAKGVTSVTTLLSKSFQAFDPDAVLDQHYKRWQQNPMKKTEYYGKSREQIKEMWDRKGKEAATEGTKLHAAIEAYYNGDDIEYDSNRAEWRQFLAFQKRFNLAAHRTEWVLWSDDHKLGGTIDLVVKNSDGSYSIYDWKRSKDKIWKEEKHWNRYGSGPLRTVKDNKYYRYSMQLNLYRELLERFYGCKITSMHIVRLHPYAKSYEVSEVARMEQETNAVLERRKESVQAQSDHKENNKEKKQVKEEYLTNKLNGLRII